MSTADVSAQTADAIAEEYCRFVDRIHGTYLDATLAMGTMARWYMDSSRAQWDALEKEGKPVTWEHLNPAVVYSGTVRGEETELHSASLQEVIARNVVDGSNWQFLGLMCVVGIYQIWDEHFRGQIAAALGVTPHDLKADIFGEIRELRKCIIHRRGYASERVAKAVLTRPFPEGAPITLVPQDLHDIADRVKEATRDLVKRDPSVLSVS